VLYELRTKLIEFQYESDLLRHQGNTLIEDEKAYLKDLETLRKELDASTRHQREIHERTQAIIGRQAVTDEDRLYLAEQERKTAEWDRRIDTMKVDIADAESRLEESRRQFEMKSIKTNHISRQFDLLDERFMDVAKLSLFTSLLGLSIGALGFWLWYERVRKYSDKVLKNSGTAQRAFRSRRTGGS
jgi:hypothetical protein